MANDDVSAKMDDIDLEIWKTVVSVQMHFNDLELRIRNFAILALGAIVTVSASSLRENDSVSLFGTPIPFASIILFIGVVVWLSFWFIDRHWYHKLLTGAVMHGIKIENHFRKTKEIISLSDTIKDNSPNTLFGKKLRSRHRLDIFYWLIAVIVLSVATALFSVSFSILIVVAALLISVIMFFVLLEGAEVPKE